MYIFIHTHIYIYMYIHIYDRCLTHIRDAAHSESKRGEQIFFLLVHSFLAPRIVSPRTCSVLSTNMWWRMTISSCIHRVSIPWARAQGIDTRWIQSEMVIRAQGWPYGPKGMTISFCIHRVSIPIGGPAYRSPSCAGSGTTDVGRHVHKRRTTCRQSAVCIPQACHDVSPFPSLLFLRSPSLAWKPAGRATPPWALPGASPFFGVSCLLCHFQRGQWLNLETKINLRMFGPTFVC